MNKGISVVLPAYKEADNLMQLLPKIKEVLSQNGIEYEILVIDTQEPMDDTKKVCRENSVKYIPRKNGNMYGDAIRTGFEEAAYDYIVVMDADGSHNPEDILRLYNRIEQSGADIVIGSRYIKGGKTDNPAILILMSYIVNGMYRLVFKIKAKDISDSFRIYQSKLVKEIKLECDNFDLVEEILIRMKQLKPTLNIQEIPICFSKRLYGESKRDLIRFIISYIKTMKRLYKMCNKR